MRKIETLILALTLSAPLALAGQSKVITNADLKGGAANGSTSASGEVTPPANATVPPMDVVPSFDHGSDASSDRLDELKSKYQKARRRKEEIEEEELPAAREEASREKPVIFVQSGGPAVLPGTYGYPMAPVAGGSTESPAKERVRNLEEELRKLDDKIEDIEAEAHKLGYGRPALMQN